MSDSMTHQLLALEKMTPRELQELWKQLYGNAPPNPTARFLKPRLAYRIQELAYGGLTQKTQQKLMAIASGLENEVAPLHHKPVIGTKLIREWGGTMHEVEVLMEGFSYQGKRYRSLSAIATLITGTRWNGPLFFGLRRRKS